MEWIFDSSPRMWQMLARIDIPVIVNSFFLWHIYVFQWNRECFFLWHKELNSRFIVVTMVEVTLDGPEFGTGFTVICWSCRLRLSWFALNFSTEIFTPYSRILPQSGFSEFVVYMQKREYEFVIFLSDQHVCRINSSRINIWCIQLTHFFHVRYQNISFPNFPPRLAHSQES